MANDSSNRHRITRRRAIGGVALGLSAIAGAGIATSLDRSDAPKLIASVDRQNDEIILQLRQPIDEAMIDTETLNIAAYAPGYELANLWTVTEDDGFRSLSMPLVDETSETVTTATNFDALDIGTYRIEVIQPDQQVQQIEYIEIDALPTG